MIFKGQKTLLSEIIVEDAVKVCLLRNNNRINKYLSSSEKISIDQQIKWIQNNKFKNDGYYFKIMDLTTQEMCGTISIYNIDREEGEFGRYIATKSLQALEAEYLLLQFAFEIMGLKRVYCRTTNENSKVWRQHYRFGFKDAGEEVFMERNMLLKIQAITIDDFYEADFSFLKNLLNKFT